MGGDRCRVRPINKGQFIQLPNQKRVWREAHDLANFAVASWTLEVISVFVPFIVAVVAINDLSVS